MNHNTKFLYDAVIHFVRDKESRTEIPKTFRESFYGTRRQVQDEIDMLERVALHIGGKITEVELKKMS